MKQKIKTIIFVFFIVLLWLPFLQQLSGHFKEPRLHGAYTVPEKPVFVADSLKTLYYQHQLEDYLNYNFGFRGFFIKVKNTLQFAFFRQFNDQDLVWGKDGWIYSYGTIARSAGLSYEGKQKNEGAINRINYLKNAVEKHGGHFLAIIAPPKEMIIPEYLPDRYASIKKQRSDYDDFVEGYKKNNIPYIDFCPYFKKIKEASPYPLFTKTGFHWSTYGAFLAEDSILKYVRALFPDALPSPELSSVELSDTARAMDADYEEPMNLFYSLNEKQYAYPLLQIKASTAASHRPKVIVVGDSYFNQIQYLDMFNRVFSDDSRFWYYFSTSFPFHNPAGTSIKSIDVVKELESADLVILLCYTGNLCKFPFGVAEAYKSKKDGHDLSTIVGDNIKNNKGWLNSILSNADLKKSTAEDIVARKADSINGQVRTLQLLAFNQKYVCADGGKNSIVIADKDKASSWETFSLLLLQNNTCAVYSYEQLFLTADLNDGGKVTATKNYIGAWETFTLLELKDGYIALKAANGKYLSVNRESLQLMANADSIGPAEKFKAREIKKE